MTHPLTLQLPETLYTSLVEAATQTGQTPEELALHWLSSAMHQVVDDPLESFIGAFNSQIPDWTDRHDSYLGQTLMQDMDESE